MSSVYDDLNDEFSAWDPMKDDYLNSGFNLYDSGPGAGLEKELQPAELAKQNTSNFSKPYLVFKKLPKNMTEKSLKNLCQRHGKVEKCYEKQNNVFVYFNNIADMEATYRALVDNDYGFKVSIGQHFLNRKEDDSFAILPERQRPIPDRILNPSDINMEDRTIIPSGKKPPRPNLKDLRNDYNELDNENCGLSKNDPLHCVKEADAHSLERAGIKIPGFDSNPENDYQYRTGRAFIKIPEKTKAFIEEKHKTSIGIYNADSETYYKKKVETGNSEVMRCIVCNVPADICCYRCGENNYIYCGIQCQNEDWEKHRLICGKTTEMLNSSLQSVGSKDSLSPNRKVIIEQHTPMPPTPSSSSSCSSASGTGPLPKFEAPKMPAVNSTVAMTCIRNANIVFIRSKDKDDVINYFQIVNKIQARVKKLKPFYNMPQVGTPVIAKLEENGEYGRGIVLKVHDADKIEINFFDYGNCETYKLADLYQAPNDIMSWPRFAVPVKLKNVPQTNMTNELRAFMYSYLRDIDLIIKYTKDDLMDNKIYCVDLYDASTNQHLNNTIATLCKPQEPKNCEDLVTIENLDYMKMPVGENIEFLIFDNSQLNTGCISGTTILFAKEIEKFCDEVERYANSLPQLPYAPRKDELCLAKYSEDGKWYRGRCLEKVGDGKPTIQYIDYGNIDFVSVKNIRPYPPKFTWPIYTADFEIAGLPEVISDDLVKRLEDLFPCYHPIRADFVEYVDDNFYSLTMKGIMQTLKEEELIN